MKLTHSLTYDAALADVHAMLADPAFRTRVVEAMGASIRELTLTPSGDGFDLVLDQDQQTAGLPSFAKKFAGETTRAIQTESWGATSGTLSIETPGKPSSAAGTITLSESGGRTTETVTLDITVKVPLIGGKLENLVADQVRAGMDTEHAVGVAWLNGENR